MLQDLKTTEIQRVPDMRVSIANRLSTEKLNRQGRKKRPLSCHSDFLIRLKRFAAARGAQSLQTTLPSLMLLS